MTYRVLLLIPEGLTFDMLTVEQQEAIGSVFGQYVLPMPSTIPYDGKVVCDGLAGDNFDPQSLVALGLPFEIIGLWTQDGSAVIEFDAAKFLNHLPAQSIYDGEGNILGTTPAILHEPHTWSGWDTVIK